MIYIDLSLIFVYIDLSLFYKWGQITAICIMRNRIIIFSKKMTAAVKSKMESV